MKKTKLSILSIALALMMILACLASFGAVTALNASADPDPRKIYYFSDSDPLIDAAAMAQEFPDFTVDYDPYPNLNENFLTMLINSFYFEYEIDSQYDYAIIQITTFKPTPVLLDFLFSQINMGDSRVIFVSNYTDEEIAHVNFGMYLYKHFTIKSSFYKYVENSVKDMWTKNYFLENLSILVDGRYIDFSVLDDSWLWCDNYTWIENDGWYGFENFLSESNMYVVRLCYYSEYLRAILEQLCVQFLHNGTNKYDYTSIVNQLAARNVRFFVHIDDFTFINLFEGIRFNFDVNEQDNYIKVVGDYDVTGMCEYNAVAMGQWELEQNYYDILLKTQKSFEENLMYFPVYIYEVDTIVYDPDNDDALKIISDTTLGELYFDIDDDEVSQLLQFLKGCLI